MSKTFKARSDITEKEYIELVDLRHHFDQIFPLAAKLNDLVNDKNFNKVVMDKLFESIVQYYKKTEGYINAIVKTLNTFGDLVS